MIKPCRPVPFTRDRSTPFSLAKRRVAGEAEISAEDAEDEEALREEEAEEEDEEAGGGEGVTAS